MADLSTVLNLPQGNQALANPLLNLTATDNGPKPSGSLFNAGVDPTIVMRNLSQNGTGGNVPNQSQMDLLNQMYAQYMGRAPDQPGMNFWTQQMNQGYDPQNIAQAFYQSSEAGKRGSPPLPRTQDQNNWKAQAQAQTANINAMPYVLDPNKLSSDTAANKALMYPAILQAGAAPYTPVGGKNIGPDLAAKSPGTDFSGAGTLDALVKMVTEKTGMSGDDAHKFIIGLIPNSSTSSISGTDTSGGLADSNRNIPGNGLSPDNAGYWNSMVG